MVAAPIAGQSDLQSADLAAPPESQARPLAIRGALCRGSVLLLLYLVLPGVLGMVTAVVFYPWWQSITDSRASPCSGVSAQAFGDKRECLT